MPRERCAIRRSASKCWALLAITSLLPIMPAGGKSTRRKQRGPHHRDRALACMEAIDSVRTAACRWLTTMPGPGADAMQTDHLHVRMDCAPAIASARLAPTGDLRRRADKRSVLARSVAINNGRNDSVGENGESQDRGIYVDRPRSRSARRRGSPPGRLPGRQRPRRARRRRAVPRRSPLSVPIEPQP
jgi:hypothetical protein